MNVITYLYPKQKTMPVQGLGSKNYVAKVQDNSRLAPLARDVVSFQSLNLFELRTVGAPYKLYDSDAIKKAVYEEVSIMQNKIFGLNEYKMLTEKNKEFLNEIIERGYESPMWASSASPREFGRIVPQRNVKDDAEFFIDISDRMRSVWDKEHPKGYNLCFIGASPSIFERIMQYQGHTVSNIPFSRTGASANIDYKDFFSKFGLTKKFVDKIDKPIIIFDYFISPAPDSSQTLGKLITAINKAGIETKPETNLAINMHINKNLIVDSFHRMLYGTNKFTNSEAKLMDEYFLFGEHIKSYATCPRMDSAEHFKNADKIKDEYEWSLSAKLINFALLDKFMAK